jgi:hypothetical protein
MTEITQAASAKSMTILLVVPADDHAVDGNQAATIVVIEVKDRTTDRRANFLPRYIDAPPAQSSRLKPSHFRRVRFLHNRLTKGSYSERAKRLQCG